MSEEDIIFDSNDAFDAINQEFMGPRPINLRELRQIQRVDSLSSCRSCQTSTALQGPQISGIADRIVGIWNGAGDAVDYSGDAIDTIDKAHTWWLKHGGKVKIIAAITGGVVLGSLIWRAVR